MVGELGISVPLSDSPEEYEIEFYSSSSYATLRGTYTASSESYDYSAAAQTSDSLTPGNTLYYRIYQISSVVGRGYVLESSG